MDLPETIGHYRILEKLGEGGMGIVYSARDERLQRKVAIKKIRPAGRDPKARERLWREARAAARLSHPNICHIYEIGDEGGEPFVVMELLEGESLDGRISRGALPLHEAVEVTLSVLGALQVLHEHGIMHRDLKPSNVFRTASGVKLVDFGLARAVAAPGAALSEEAETDAQLTMPGMVIGTPRYMSPEQLRDDTVDHRADLFAVGAILYEMLAGKPAFGTGPAVKIFHAVLYEHPPALGGSAAIAAVHRVISRALSKSPPDRYPTADAMAEDLRRALVISDATETVRARPMARLMVLPFRVLRPDPEIDFLAFSLPDAITAHLSGLDSLIVRSSLAAARFGADLPDFRRIAEEADVDMVLTASLLRAGPRLRVSAQLVEAPGGEVLWTETSEVSLGDIFGVQDDLVRRIVGSLAQPLTARESKALNRDTPSTARAYEFYLRGNRLSLEPKGWDDARMLYEECLAEDPMYAPAWARLGRIHRLLAKYLGRDPKGNLERASSAFRRALELNPDLTLAQNLQAQLEVEAGRPAEAMARLLKRARDGRPDPEIYSGLVHASRYCGLLQASLAAHREATNLDPAVRTSVGYTYFLLGQYERALELHGGDEFLRGFALVALERFDEARECLRGLESGGEGPRADLAAADLAVTTGDAEGSLAAVRRSLDAGFQDPEGIYFAARGLARLEADEPAVELFARIVGGGYCCFSALARDPWLERLRHRSDFREILRRAEAGHREAAACFVREGGDVLLGPGSRD
jgi:serine/threonine protein kinase/tetratricopeptide (TPR) repeat protein